MADYSLDLVQNERYRRGFRYRVEGVARDLSAYSWAGQARQRESRDAELILDLQPYLTLDPADPTRLLLDIPATVTANIERAAQKAAWDLTIWPTGAPEDGIVLVQGPVTLDASATVRP
jgi:hypothetical protein